MFRLFTPQKEISNLSELKQIKCETVALYALPPLLHDCFNLLKESGANYFALFGGAVRDADYAAYYCKPCLIKDYDIQIWFAEENFQEQLDQFLGNLRNNSGRDIREEASVGTGRIRYIADFNGVELDISVRPIPLQYQYSEVALESVAIERASDSDVGLSSVAIDPLGGAWAMPEYIQDRKNKTLTCYPTADLSRNNAYIQHMQLKFPEHRVVELDEFLPERSRILNSTC